jgi:cytochrome c peroxidase
MHDGSLESLEQVIAHYASGGKQHPNQSPLIKEFEISETETQDLINFLESLSDLKFLNNSKFSP